MEKESTYIDPNYTVQWYRTRLDGALLKSLNERSDWKGFAQAGGFIAVLCSTGLLSFYLWANQLWVLMVFALFLHGMVSAFCINGIHELVHGTVFKTKWLNKAFAGVLSLYSWSNHLAFWESHSEHHKFTLHDPHDQEVVVPVEVTLADFLRSLTIDLPGGAWILKLHTQLARGKTPSDWHTHLFGESERRFAVFNWSRLVLAFHAGVILFSLASGLWILPFILTLTPLYRGGIQFLLNQTQHVGMPDHETDFRINSRSIRINPVLRFLYWHMNWHIEHHMFAGVPCYNLKKLHNAIKPELPYTWNGLKETWFHIIGVLYRQKQDPSYAYRAKLPGESETPAERATHSPPPDRKAKTEEHRTLVSATRQESDYKLWECSVCGFIYDERLGLPEEGIEPGTRWTDIPEDWNCPDCGVAKADFTMKEIKRRDAQTNTDSASIAISDVKAVASPLVVIGSGMAAYTLIREFRSLDKDTPVYVVTEDNGDFYSKPAISNAFAEEKEPNNLIMQSGEKIAKRLDFMLIHSTKVEAIHTESKTLHLSNRELNYGRLVLACGAEPIRVPLEGDAADSVLTVNNLEDYRVLRQKMQTGESIAIIGAGLIGCEFANDFVANGFRVNVIDLAETPLGKLLPPEIGEKMKEALAREGVNWHLQNSVTKVSNSMDGDYELHLSDGSTIIADHVVSAIGLRPQIELAKSAGIEIGRGIRVNVALQASAPDIYALGDCAEIGGTVRPYILPIMQAARALAKTLHGQYTEVHFPVMPVVVKTPAYPLTVVPPESETGEWTTKETEKGAYAEHIDRNKVLDGYVIAGDQNELKASLTAAIGKLKETALPA